MMPDFCSIVTPTQSKGADGTISESDVTLSNVPCTCQPTSSTVGIEFQRETGRTTYDVFVPMEVGGTAITAAPRARVVCDGKTMEVVGSERDQAARGSVQLIIAADITGGRTA